eukprot:CAMPEP_0203949372 /NCGR_PEP_ID=MMETSP0359-20131031/83798_1 /ASSEMBLY_ACC=CAM_ASM_000338 /TAXON_ID=268821 /ORGANISM="Scrippsiella Hangoei, Strain SHTV-5" /LENGTH=82 /DNA_ID=CAMNT_0050881267 /DNA_START=21 /DNA_END=269 /DNA_ORIENTATION=+
MCAPSSPAPSGSKTVPDWALAMLAQTSRTDKQCRNDKAAEHVKTRFLIRLKTGQPVLLSSAPQGTESCTENGRTVRRMQQQL